MSHSSYNITTLIFAFNITAAKTDPKELAGHEESHPEILLLILLMYSTLHPMNSHRHSSNKCCTTEEKYSYMYKMKKFSQIPRLVLID